MIREHERKWEEALAIVEAARCRQIPEQGEIW